MRDNRADLHGSSKTGNKNPFVQALFGEKLLQSWSRLLYAGLLCRAQCANLVPAYHAQRLVRNLVAFLSHPVPSGQSCCLLGVPCAQRVNLLPSYRAPPGASYRASRPVRKSVAFLPSPVPDAQTCCFLTAPRAQGANLLPSYRSPHPVRKFGAFLPRPTPSAQTWCLLTAPRLWCANLLPSDRTLHPVRKPVAFLPRRAPGT